MEIERKWDVTGWPEGLLLIKEQCMRQGYLTTRPTVRIREERTEGEGTEYVLCIKSPGGLAREEIEILIPQEKFDALERMIGKPLIEKRRNVYALKNGLTLEVNLVDGTQEGAWMYAEIEYKSVEEALLWRPEEDGLTNYLAKEVTGIPGSTMGAYWEKTRGCIFGKDALQ